MFINKITIYVHKKGGEEKREKKKNWFQIIIIFLTCPHNRGDGGFELVIFASWSVVPILMYHLKAFFLFFYRYHPKAFSTKYIGIETGFL
jgi:hypothetical protein